MLRRKDAPMVGIAMRDAADGETVEVQTIGTDVVEDQKLVQESVADAFAEAVKAGIRPPGPLAVAEVQVFYEGGRPVEVRVAGKIAKVDQRIDDRPSVYVFAPWSSNPAPRWAEDGDLLPEDAARSHLVVKSTSAMLDGEMKPILRRSWNFVEHTNLWVTPWRNFRDLAEAEAEQPEDLQAVAHLVLDRQQDEGAAYALTHAGAPFRDRLVRELKKRLRDLWQRIGMDDAPVSEEAGATVNEGAAKWLAEKFPTGGAESAEELRRRAEGAPWTPWWPEDGEDFAFLLRRLVTLTWRNGLEADAARARARQAALPRVTAIDLSGVATKGALFLPGLDDGTVRFKGSGKTRATITGGLVNAAAVREGLTLMPSMPFHRLIRTLVYAGYDQAEAGVEDFRVVCIDGGWSGLTDRLGLSSKHRKDVRLIAEAGARLEWVYGNRQGIAWWTLDGPAIEDGGVIAHRGRNAEVVFTLGTMLLPYAGRKMKQQKNLGDDPRDWRLVPELRSDPPMLRDNEQAQIYTMARRFLTLMVDRAVELARDGGLHITPDVWEDLAAKSGLPKKSAPKVVAKWADGDGDNRPPLIEYMPGGVLVRLSQAYQAEHDFIVSGGEKRSKQDKNIKASHRRKKGAPPKP